MLGTSTPATAAVTSAFVARPETSGIAVTSALASNLVSVSALVYTFLTFSATVLKSEFCAKVFKVFTVSASKPATAFTASLVA